MSQGFISLDWGTTSFRASHVGADGKVVNETSAPEGIMAISNGAFEETLEKHIGSWSKSLPVLASGMITSRQGWVECDYGLCPSGASELAKKITAIDTKLGRKIFFLTGLHYRSPSLGHDVIRGEETQVIGSLASGASHFITRGTHCKWIDVTDNKITSFATYMTGESFGLYQQHSILGRLMKDAPEDEASFTRGVEKAFKDPAGLLHHLFSVRSLGLFDDLAGEQLASYLSGLLIGHEVAHAIVQHKAGAKYVLLGSKAHTATAMLALNLAGLNVELGSDHSAIAGQAIIGKAAGIL